MILSWFVFFGCEIAADKLSDEIRDVLGRFGFSDLAAGRDDIIRSSWRDQDKFIADKAAGAHLRNDDILEFHIRVQP